MMPLARASSSAGSPLVSSNTSSAVILATKPFWADTGTTRSRDTPSISAEVAHCRSIWDWTCSAVLSVSQSVSILFNTTKRASTLSGEMARCSRQIERSERVTPVSALKMNTTACAWGMRLTVNSGSAPTAFRPGVSRITNPCFKSGCGILMMAWRHMGTSTMPCASGTGFSSVRSSCQKPSARALSKLTLRTSATFSRALAIWSALPTSRGISCQRSALTRHSARLCI